jgi:leader peptidase (prepilin peptidase)/N-methyltransferase
VAAVYGLLMGSFVNAWAYRLPRKISVVRGRSFCPHCKTQIKAYDNVPLVSWLVLRGRCRACGAAISPRYPIVEGLTALLYVLVALHDGWSWLVVPHLVFVTALVMVSEVDVEWQIIPDAVVLPVAALGLALMIVLEPHRWLEWLVSGLGAALFLFVIAEVYRRLRGIEGMGMGDVKLALCMGVYLGAAVIPALFIGFVVGAVAGVLLMAVAGKSGKTAIPFGPFLAAGAVVALFLGQPIIHAYLRLILH